LFSIVFEAKLLICAYQYFSLKKALLQTALKKLVSKMLAKGQDIQRLTQVKQLDVLLKAVCSIARSILLGMKDWLSRKMNLDISAKVT